MARGDSTYTRKPIDKITLGEAQALVESKVIATMRGPLVAIRFAFGLSMVALTVAVIALTVALVR